MGMRGEDWMAGVSKCSFWGYLGNDGKGAFHALWPHHKVWEIFCARKHPAGGYVLLTLHGEVFWKMSIIGDKLMETGVLETRWEFESLRGDGYGGLWTGFEARVIAKTLPF